MNTNLYEATSLISQSFAIDHKKRHRRSLEVVSEKTAVFCPSERRLWRLFVCRKRSKYNYVNIQHFPKCVIIYNDAILHPKLIKFCNLIRLFTGFSTSAADEFAADIHRLWPIARCSLAGSSGVGLTSIPVDLIRRCLTIDIVFPNIFIDKLISDTRDSNFLHFENITFIEIWMSDSES